MAQEYIFSCTVSCKNCKTGISYECRVENDDRFWGYLKPYIEDQQVKGETSLRIDSIIIPTEMYEEKRENLYDFTIKYVIGTYNKLKELVFDKAYTVTIPRVRFVTDGYSPNQKFNGDTVELEMYQIVLGYMTKIESILMNSEDE